MAKVKITRNDTRISARVTGGKKKMIYAVAEQALKDCNVFCRQDQGVLISSSYSASVPQEGKLIWNTPYAKRVYYTGRPSHDVNPHASLMWCEVARNVFGDDWDKIAQKAYTGGMGS